MVDSACPPRRKRIRRRSEIDKWRFASWNIGSFTNKFIELVKALRRRKISIACTQETKWLHAKAKEIDGYKLWYSRLKRGKNRFWHFVQEGFSRASC